MDKEFKEKLEKQGYRFLGEHSALKICSWTKKSIRGQGVCYKQKFYGIRSHLCAQISTTVNYCDMACEYCWRERHNEPFDIIDSPIEILDKIDKNQRDLVIGFKGSEASDKIKLKASEHPQHIAISLTGETLYYPKLNKLIFEISKKGLTSFVVTNGMLPDVLRDLNMPTQLYISIDAPNSELQQKLCNPIHADAWDRLIKSLDVMNSRHDSGRMALRITLIKKINMITPEKYGELIEKANPHFVEVKAYMYVGASRERLELDNMPTHSEVKEFALKICEFCGYKIIDEQEESRVLLLMREDFDERIMKFD
ncbi:4-demethylwyosine synthase TYW1 [Candidatus Woesearchaeota archaeon]|nr:4-demethylwyosine synthase TYW1 [Candidatus Woesearchaeota archaeon]MBT6519597.1 4-demethylwyosine synthase TYW1 [Candidatus Woesearchaeota archaeon]MBT7367512.1 4-demethylwyosine synthase TYW1 [Candidatus Woesearchaeota archaeon]